MLPAVAWRFPSSTLRLSAMTKYAMKYRHLQSVVTMCSVSCTAKPAKQTFWSLPFFKTLVVQAMRSCSGTKRGCGVSQQELTSVTCSQMGHRPKQQQRAQPK